MSVEFELYSSDSESSRSDVDSFAFSSEDEGSSANAKFGPSSTPLDLHSAYFTTAVLPPNEPGIVGRANLRKNETAYMNDTRNENILPMPSGCSSEMRDIGPLSQDNREVVGYFVDKSGSPVAEWCEELPPPPNANYSHMKQQNSHLLSRAMGYDPNVYRKKTDVEGIMNAADPINGDAQLSAARTAEVVERQDLQAFNTRSHMQSFADQETSRSGLYDGLNPKLSAPQRVLTKLNRSWREVQPPPQAPQLPTAQAGGGGPVHAARSAKRVEVGSAFSRKPMRGVQIMKLDSVMDIPIASTKTQREKEGGEGLSSSAVPARSARSVDTRDGRSPETEGWANLAASATGQAVRSAPSDVPEGMRESDTTPFVTESTNGVQGTSAPPQLAQREGGEDDELCRIEMARLEGFGASAQPQLAQREGGEAVALSRSADASGRPDHVVSGPVTGDRSRDAREDSTLTEDARRVTALADVAQPVHGAVRTSCSDAIKVKDERAGSTIAAQAGPAVGSDQLDTRRAQHASSVPLRASDQRLGSVIRVGEQRIPLADEATFVFMGSQSSLPARQVASAADGMQRDRTKTSQRQAVGGASPTEFKSAPMQITPARTNGGTQALPDRLRTGNTVERTRIDQRVSAHVGLSTDRSTPTAAMMATRDTPLNQSRLVGEVQHSSQGRETPIRSMAPSPAVLRG